MIQIKRKHIKLAIMASLLMVLMVIIAINSFQLPKEEEYSVTGNLNDYAGSLSITNGNLNNESFITISNQKSYYLTDTKQLVLKDNNSGNTKMLTRDNDIVYFLSSDDKYVYCLICDINTQKNGVWDTEKMCFGGNIYRIDKQSDKFEKLIEINDNIQILNFFKKGDWIYYISSGMEEGFFRINIESTQKERLLGKFTNKINYSDEKFYYLENNEYNIACMDLLGENKKTFWDNNKYLISEFQVEDDNIYFITNYNDNNLIVVVNMETFEEEILVKTKAQISNFNISNEVMYYTMVQFTDDLNFSIELMQYDTDKNENKIVERKISLDNIILIDNSIYYYKNKYFANGDHLVELIKYDGFKNEKVY